MNRKIFARCLYTLLCGGLLIGSLALADEATTKATEITIKGTCTFGGTKSSWSGKLTPTSKDGVYDASYVAAWGGSKAMTYVGQVTTDFKTTISGNGKSTGGGGNGTFAFDGKFGDDGVAKCPYKEVGGRGRSGSLTVDTVTK